MKKNSGKKRILIINTSGLGIGGITTNILNYINELKELYNFTVVGTICSDDNIVNNLKNMNCTVEMLSNRKKKLFKYIKELQYLIKRERFDIVHIHGNSSLMSIELIISKRYGIKKRIVHCHNSKCNHPILNKILNPALKRLMTDALACSSVAGEWIFGKNNFIVIHNAFNYRQFIFNEEIRNKERTFYKIKEDEIVLAMVGNLNKQKNPKFIIEVFKELIKEANCKLIFIGDGPLRTKLENLTEKYNLQSKILFLGICNDIQLKMQMIDIYLFPSLFEGLGISILEAQASGCICVASENIPKETKYSEDIDYLSLDIKKWKLELLKKITDLKNRNRLKYAYKAIELMELDYDLKKESYKLREIYSKE